jgi:arginase
MKPLPNALEKQSIGLLGIPFDEYSSYLKGAAAAPDRIRDAYHCPSSNLWSELGLDLGRLSSLYDLGNLEFKDGTDPFSIIKTSVSHYLSKGGRMVCLGGDHSITYPVIAAHAEHMDNLNILHFDAHPDLYDQLDGNQLSHACPFARIMENRFASRLVQVGIRTMNGHQKAQAERFKVDVHEMKDGAVDPKKLTFDGPVYISFDMDCLDPGFAPGVSHFEPGGMSVRQAVEMIQNIEATIIGADIVEYNPIRDLNGMTAMVAAKLMKEIISRICLNNLIDKE